MSSHFPAKSATVAFGLAALIVVAGCNKSPATDTATTTAETKTAFVPTRTAGLAAGQVDPRVLPYLNSKAVVMEGKTLYQAHNCNGCHSNGGGGMGPSLMDDEWIYGGRIEDIHATLVEGRPNGMPHWKDKMPDVDLWKIATYVRSMSLPATLAAARNNTPSQDPAPVPESVETQ
ncbi:c-type cytochrome [Glacieibacterium sp.]|uniref:c-type cytochrome n=1 Tax=Glacieibacterium sp. TaxID=2860237 RepID=UPI003B00B85E